MLQSNGSGCQGGLPGRYQGSLVGRTQETEEERVVEVYRPLERVVEDVRGQCLGRARSLITVRSRVSPRPLAFSVEYGFSESLLC